MKLKIALTTIAVVAASMAFTSGAAGATTETALWSNSTSGTANTAETDCGSGGTRYVDDSHFCVIDDDGSVELGVRFTTAQSVVVTGVRVYRVDTGTAAGSLWSADGAKLATGTFDASAGLGWQDLHFSTAVATQPGQVYVASYSATNAKYAFEWNYYTDQSRTAGPITAMQSTEAQGNGVFCYVGSDCDLFPTSTFRDTNYWVSPLWTPYLFSGFAQPVDPDKQNVAKAGSAIPVKFGLGGDLGLAILTDGYPKARPITCDSMTPTDAIETTVTGAGSSTLTYDATSARYVYVWKTTKAWAGSCYRFDLGLNDGSHHTFDVRFTR